MGEVDNLTVRQMFALLEQIRKYPPTNVLLTEFLKGLGGGKDSDIDSALSKIPHTVEKKTSSKIVKVVNKRTGKRII